MKPPITFTGFTPCLVYEDQMFGYLYHPNSSGHLQQYNEIDNQIIINSLGFHDVEHDFADDNKRILILGDSFTSAIQVPIEKGWTQIIDQTMDDTTVINLGVDGYGTDRQLKLLQYFAPRLEPDAVIVAFFENDIQDILAQITLDCYEDHLLVYQTDSQKQQLISYLNEHRPSEFSYWLADHFYLYRAVAILFSDSGFLLSTNGISPRNLDIQLEPLPEMSPDLMHDLLSGFEELAKEYDFQVYFIPVPSKGNPEDSLHLLAKYLDETEWSHIQIVDVYPAMVDGMMANDAQHLDYYFQYDGHFNEKGYALFGEKVAEFMQAQDLLK